MSESVTYMTKQDIFDTIKDLSRSQGFYQRLYHSLIAMSQVDPDSYNSYLLHLQQQHFKDPVDLVIYLES